MSFTLLQMIDQVSGEMGLAQPTVVVGSGNLQTIQLLALTQRLGKDLVREFEWQALGKAYPFSTTTAVTSTGTTTSASAVVTSVTTASLAVGDVITGTGIPAYAEVLTIDSSSQLTMTVPASASGTVTLTFAKQDYALPSDYDRMISDTNWDRTNHWRNIGPQSSQAWQTLQGGLISTGPRERFRIYGNKLRIFPALTTVYNMEFEYVSNFWVTATGGTAPTKALFTVDTDTCIWPDTLMLAGIKYYFLKAKKLDFGVEQGEFMDRLSVCKAQDEPQAMLNLSARESPLLIGPWSVQDGNWPTTSI